MVTLNNGNWIIVNQRGHGKYHLSKRFCDCKIFSEECSFWKTEQAMTSFTKSICLEEKEQCWHLVSMSYKTKVDNFFYECEFLTCRTTLRRKTMKNERTSKTISFTSQPNLWVPNRAFLFVNKTRVWNDCLLIPVK